MDTPGPELAIEKRDNICILFLNRPEASNAVNEELHSRLADVWDELERDSDCAVVVLTGRGKSFSAGGDMQLLLQMHQDAELRYAILREAKRILGSLIRFPLPVIAAVNGPAVGLGCSLAGLSDLVIIEEDAYFADPHVSVGLVAGDGGILTWPRMLSLLRAKEYLFTGDRIPATTACELGLANRVVANGTSLDEALILAERLAKQPAQALRDTKRALNMQLERTMIDVMDFAVSAENLSIASSEHGTIVRRFIDEHTP